MKQYRKKPVTIEAVQFDGLNPTEIKDFVGENCEVEIYDNGVTPPVARIVIHTLEGDMEVSKGDYVIKGVKGEFYPCKPDIFEQTYESAETQKELEEEDLKWRRIRTGERIPCNAYLYNLAYERKNNFGGKITIDGYLLPNIKGLKCGCDTWYLPVEAIKNLPKEDEK